MSKGSSVKALPLDDDDEEENVGHNDGNGAVLNVNQAYAERLAHNKKREALHRLQELKKRGVVDSSDEEESDDEDDVSDDGLLPAHTDARIFETLAKIKQKDPSIYSLESKFFDDKDEEDDDDPEKQVRPSLSSNGSKPHKPVYLKDALAKQLIEDGSDFDEDDSKSKRKRIVTYADDQQSYKNEFLRSAKLDDDDNDDGNGFLKLRRKEQPQAPDDAPELAPYDKDISQRLEEYFGKDDHLDENDKFLKDFLLKKSWVDEDANRIPSYEDIVGDVIEDEEELEKQDRFEAEYNFRFEEGVGSQVMGHSRIVNDSVRRKDDARKQKREKKKERLSEAAFERREELKRLKNIKKKQILEKLKKIRTVAGVKESDEKLLQEEDLEEEFDPDEYDKKMREAFGEEYYGAEDADENFQAYDMDDFEKPNFEDEDEILGLPKGWDEDVAGSAKAGFSAARQRAKDINLVDSEPENMNVEGKDFDSDDSELDKENEEAAKHGGDDALPSHSISKRKKKAKISLREKLAFDKQLEEYYKLDYEDMVGDLPTRFKYRQVKPSMYGLSTSEILAADDKDLNQYVSLKKLAPYVTQEWKPKWRFQVSQKMRKKKALKLQIPTQKADHANDAPLVEGGNVKGKSSTGMQHEVPEQVVSGAEGSKHKKKRRKKGLSLSESRLIAYGKISLPSRKRKRG